MVGGLEGAVTDIVVRDGVCTVLCAADETRKGGKPRFRGTVYAGRDLEQWSRVAEASFPALPTSVEVADGAYYVGLSNHAAWESADKASGTIWRLGP